MKAEILKLLEREGYSDEPVYDLIKGFEPPAEVVEQIFISEEKINSTADDLILLYRSNTARSDWDILAVALLGIRKGISLSSKRKEITPDISFQLLDPNDETIADCSRLSEIWDIIKRTPSTHSYEYTVKEMRGKSTLFCCSPKQLIDKYDTFDSVPKSLSVLYK